MFDIDYGEHDLPNAVSERTSGARVDLVRDVFGRLSALVGDDGARLTLHRDRKGQDNGLTDERGNRTVLVRDDFGRVTARVSPDGGTTRFRLDAAGNPVLERGTRCRPSASPTTGRRGSPSTFA